MADQPLSRELQQAGARRRRGKAPASVDYDWLRAECVRLERVLRMQYAQPGQLATGKEKLPAQLEQGLAAFPLGKSTTTALRRWAYIKHLYLLRSEKLVHASEGDARAAARALLRRDPVNVELTTGRVVGVTARSYAATHAIARHWFRIRMLDAELELAAAQFQEIQVEVLTVGWMRIRRRITLRRRLRRLEETHRRLSLEMIAQRQAMYAHAFTADGAPASSLEQAPAWWIEVDPADDLALLEGLAEAGPGRWKRIQAAMPVEAGTSEREPWQDSWGGLFALIERESKLEPASCYDRDLYQLLAWVHQFPDRKAKDA